MQFPILRKIAKNKISWLLFVISTGIVFGLIIIRLFFRIKSTYATFLLAAAIAPFAMMIVGSSKRMMIALLAVCLPITVDFTINYTWHAGGASGYMISLFDMALMVLYSLWFAEMMYKRNVNIKFYPSFSIPAILLICFACLSIIPAKCPEFSIYEIIEVVKMYFAFIYIANNINKKHDVQFIMSLIIACLFFEGLLGWAQHRYDMPLFPTALGGPHWIDGRVAGTWVSYNDFAWYLTFVLPIAFSILFSEINYLYKLICGLSLFFGFGALIWTGSRSGWISCAAAIAFTCPFLFCKIKGKTGIIKVFVTIMAIVILVSPLYPRLYAKLFVRFTGDDRGAAASRMPQFMVALNIIKENPIIGIGINNYVDVMHDYDETLDGIYSITVHSVHNIFLQITAEMGILGLFAFLWLIAVIFIKGLKFVISNEGINVYSVVGMLGGIMAFLIHGLFDTATIGSKLFLFNWFFAGIIFAVIEIHAVEQKVAS